MGEKFLLLLFSLAAVLGTAFLQTGCPLPTNATINSSLETIINNSRGGEAAGSVISITNFHYTCQALGDRVGLFRSLSIAVKYTVTGQNITLTRVAQIQLGCNNGTGMFTDLSGTLEQSVNESLVFSLATRRDCRSCTDNDTISNVDAVANCACEYQP